MKLFLTHISALLLFTFTAMAQTSNEGVLYVSEGTEFSTVERFNNLETAAFYNDGDAFIYSHFNNDGEVDFYQNTGLTRFIGNAIQSISGSKVSYLYDVYFNNTSNGVPFEVSGDLNISGEADLYNGIVDNDNFGGAITFNTDAFHINTSDYSHIDGPVSKFGDKAFTYPIGDGGYYRFAGISAPANASGLFEGKYYFQNSNPMYSHELKAGVIEEIDNQEYWTINKESAADEEMLITLSWREETTPQSMINAASQEALTIVRWDEETNMWVNEGGVVDMDNQTVTTAVSGYGVYTFGLLDKGKVLSCGVTVYNAVTPNNDGLNDFFFIDTGNMSCARDLHVQIFNRWGVKVFESFDYGVNGDVFDGFSDGRLTLNNSNQLPTGTYYYILDYEYDGKTTTDRHKEAGYLYLSGN
ncbi:gliding motility-associated C-terminal domain-containing protein [Oceanihabitans sediminis]|uniref:gliding motility-associated C-terminal domain-containing protein n=1 Tax=Oceanihabitans sediminis TaxID=1812012 RepID=UPI003A95CFAF